MSTSIQYGGPLEHRRMALASVGKASSGISPTKNPPPPIQIGSAPKPEPLFSSWKGVDSDHLDDDEYEPALDAAIEESLEEQEERDLEKAIQASRSEVRSDLATQSSRAGSSNYIRQTPNPRNREHIDESTGSISIHTTAETSRSSYIGSFLDSDVKMVSDPNGLGTLLASPTSYNIRADFESPSNVVEEPAQITTSAFFDVTPPGSPIFKNKLSAAIVLTKSVPITNTASPLKTQAPQRNLHMPIVDSTAQPIVEVAPISLAEDTDSDDFDDDEMEEVDLGLKPNTALKATSAIESVNNPPVQTSLARPEEDEEPSFDWSRSPSPAPVLSTTIVDEGFKGQNGDNVEGVAEKEAWDAADEVNVEQEEDAFADFISQVKGKDLDTVRGEIEQEINELNKAEKAHQRDSEEVTQQMVGQIMVSL
jgi:DNA excision repair protein ERCC-5